MFSNKLTWKLANDAKLLLFDDKKFETRLSDVDQRVQL